MIMTQNITENTFLIFHEYFSSPECFTDIKEKAFWDKYKHGLYLSKPDNEGKRQYYLPISSYIQANYIGFEVIWDDDDDDVDETIIPLTQPHTDDGYQYAAIYYHEQVYLSRHLTDDHSSIQHYFNSDQQEFILKSSPYSKHKIKPLLYANPNVYIGEHFFRDREIFFLMRDVGKNLYDFLQLQPQLSIHVLENIISKIIQFVSIMHEKSIVHTDLKLENICIKLDSNGELNLNIIDFDDAVMPEFNARRPSVIPGTFSFYAPELFKNLPSSVNHFFSLMAFQDLAFHIIEKTATIEQVMAIEIASNQSCDICFFPKRNKHSTPNNIQNMSPFEFMKRFIRANFNEIIGIETDLFALGCIIHILLTIHHPEPEKSRFYETMTTLLSHNPASRRQF
jgi:serine/threonine protein kinase